MIDCRVYIAFHQNGEVIPKDKCYSALHVGKSISNLQLNIKSDADGENISAKNEIYSELTGWYWIWKNQRHDYIGTAHYRRFFTAKSMPFFRKIGKLLLYFIGLQKKRHGIWYVHRPEKWQDKIVTSAEIQILIKDFDIILPQKKRFNKSVYEQYSSRHKETDILLTMEILKEKFPEYLDSFNAVFNSSEMYAFNMFIMPWHLFDNYMKWLFTILFELEIKTKIDKSDKYQKRVCAFMAERLQTVWIEKNKLNVKELPVLYFKSLKVEHF